VDRLAALAASIESNPPEVAREARQIASAARIGDDWQTLSRAQSVVGRCWRILGEVNAAEDALNEAITAAQRCGVNGLIADAHLALAGVLSMGGRWSDAFSHLDEVERLGSPEQRGIAELQRGAVCRDAGRVDDAERIFADAVPRLRCQSRSLDLARALTNLGGLHLGRGRVAVAIRDYEEAAELFRSVGQDFIAVQLQHNLGCAVANLGDLPRALQLLDEATTLFADFGHDASVPMLSRAEALLDGGLSADALDFSQRAARRLEAEGNRAAAAEALLAVAEAARLEGEPAVALKSATTALRWFAAEQSVSWKHAAELEVQRCRHENGDLDVAALDQLHQLAESFSETGNLRNEILTRCLIVLAATENGRDDIAGEQSALAKRLARPSRLLQIRLAVHHACATHRLALGDRVGARRALRGAFNELATARQLRGAGDSGAATATHARATTRLAIQLASGEVHANRALAWMEQAASCTWFNRPVLPPTNDDVAGDFARLRVVAGDLRHAEQRGEPTADLRRQQSQLEQSMRSEWLKSTQPLVRFTLPRLSDMKKVVGDTQLVSIASAGESLLVVIADRRSTRSRVVRDLEMVSESVRRARDSLSKLAATGSAPSIVAARRRSFVAGIDAIDSLLLAPLGLDAAHVVLVLTPDMFAIPWAAMPSLRGRSFTLAPSVSWWLDAASRRTPPPDSALVVAGPRLAEATAEAHGVASCYPAATVLTGTDATVANVGAALAHHDVVHFVAHGTFRHDNPLWSTIELADGPLSVYELERIGPVPPTVVLATCDSGIGGGHSGAQLHGLAGTLLTMGAQTIVAAIGALPDNSETRETMVTLHRDLVRGVSASASLARQRAADNDASGLTAARLVTLGVG
jgi:tetratricopeptide (TPR) repeat protein